MKFIIYAILAQRARTENLKKSICHFSTNRKRPFFLSANKRARRIMNLVASDSIHFEVSRGFLSSVLTKFCPFYLSVIVKNKLTSVFHASVLLLTMNFVITLSK